MRSELGSDKWIVRSDKLWLVFLGNAEENLPNLWGFKDATIERLSTIYFRAVLSEI